MFPWAKIDDGYMPQPQYGWIHIDLGVTYLWRTWSWNCEDEDIFVFFHSPLYSYLIQPDDSNYLKNKYN